MIEYHKHNEIDREQWDNCIRNSGGTKPYAFSWFLDIMSPGWEALIDDDYDSVFPLPCSRKYGINYLATPIFLQQLGAFSPDKEPSESLSEFLEYIPQDYRLIDLCVGHKPFSNGFAVSEKVNLELDLSKPYEKLRDRFSAHCKRNIETAEKKKPEVVNDVTPDELISLFINNRGKDINNIKIRDYDRLRNLMNFCIKNKKGRILGVRGARKVLLYGIFVVEATGSKTMILIANTPQSREKRIGHFIVNELIKQYSSTKSVLDFSGSSIPSVAAFMESFGSRPFPFYRIYSNRLIWPLRLLK